MARTSYGKKEKGNSKFVIVAPHAGGDDLRTQELAEEIGQLISASVVINEAYVQSTSSRAYKSIYVEDFNNLPWSDSRKEYEWNKRRTPMKEFYEHIKEYSQEARKNADGSAIIVYIHGMDDDGTNLGIDIGFGAKYHGGRLKGAQVNQEKHPDSGNYTGYIRARSEDIEKLQKVLSEKLKADYAMHVGIGERYVAWSRQNGIQYHAGTPDYSFQLEISSFLRKPNRIKYTAKLIADGLKMVYK